MKLKSLILGSATAALAATGAQAADAIVIAEPEPVEYVRVCDVYGAGYFYIPGTETCLRINGWVRHQIGSNVISGSAVATGVNAAGALIAVPAPLTNPIRIRARDRQLHQTTGAQINFDARSETEYGMLRGWVQLESPAAAGTDVTAATDIGVAINRAVIQLGGLYMGYLDSLYTMSSVLAGGSLLGNTVGFTSADTFGYHYEQRQQIGYQFSSGNLWGAVSLEHDPATNNYTPDIVGKIAYSQAWGGVWLAAGYDESADGVGIRGGVQYMMSPLTVRLDGWYRSNPNVTYGPNAGGAPISRWAVQATARYQINPKFDIAGGIAYYDDLVEMGSAVHTVAALVGVGGPLVGVPVTATNYFTDGHAWQAQIGVNWRPVTNFTIGADLGHTKMTVSEVNAAGDRFTGKSDATSFRIRFQRDF